MHSAGRLFNTGLTYRLLQNIQA